MLSRPGRQFTTRAVRSAIARSPRRGFSYGSNGLVYETLVEMQERYVRIYLYLDMQDIDMHLSFIHIQS